MSHIAIQEMVDSRNVDWMEQAAISNTATERISLRSAASLKPR
jgi:hypothetical protein